MAKGRVNRIIKPEHAGLRDSPMPTIGKISVGEFVEAKGDKRGYPRSLGYFRATGTYSKAFHNVYGEEPKSIPIIFVSDEPSKSCCEVFEWRNHAGAKVAEFDGERLIAWDDPSSANARVVPFRRIWSDDNGQDVAYADGDTFYKFEENQWKEVSRDDLVKANKITVKLRETYGEPRLTLDHEMQALDAKHGPRRARLMLRFVVLGLRGLAGLWTFITRAEATSGPDIRDAFDQVRAQLGGRVAFLPFDLNVEVVETKHVSGSRRFPRVTLVLKYAVEDKTRLLEWLRDNPDFGGVVTPEVVLTPAQSQLALPSAPKPKLGEHVEFEETTA